MTTRYKIDIYPSLLNCERFTIGEKDVRSFDTKSLTNEEKSKLTNFIGIELSFNSQDLNSSLQVSTSILAIIKSIEGYEKILCLRELTQAKSKTRSFKGILKSLKIPEIQYLEKEVDVNNFESYFVSLIDMSSISPIIFKELFFNYSQNFILLRKCKPTLNLDDFHILVNGNIYKNEYGIDYLNLLLYLTNLDDSNLLLRAGGDGGKSILSLQLFAKKKLAPALISFFENSN
jgi:hypothetical protein